MGAGVAVGTGLAILLFVILELLNTSIRRASDITKSLDIRPLATLPRFETPQTRRRRRIWQVVFFLIIVVTVPAILWGVDQFYMPLDQIFTKVMERLS